MRIVRVTALASTAIVLVVICVFVFALLWQSFGPGAAIAYACCVLMIISTLVAAI